jgi:hypothetical protein
MRLWPFLIPIFAIIAHPMYAQHTLEELADVPTDMSFDSLSRGFGWLNCGMSAQHYTTAWDHRCNGSRDGWAVVATTLDGRLSEITVRGTSPPTPDLGVWTTARYGPPSDSLYCGGLIADGFRGWSHMTTTVKMWTRPRRTVVLVNSTTVTNSVGPVSTQELHFLSTPFKRDLRRDLGCEAGGRLQRQR